MGYKIGDDRNQQVLVPSSLEEYVGSESVARFIDAWVDQLDLHALGCTKSRPASTGRPAYHPGDLLKLYIYGYYNGIRSSRKLERETYRNLEVLWLLKNLRPDHKTISEFRRSNTDALQGVLRDFVLFLKDLTLIGNDLVAIDGSKFAAVNSNGRNYTNAKLKRLLAKVETAISEYLQKIDDNDRDDQRGGGATRSDLEQRLENLQKRKAQYQSLSERLNASDQSQMSLTDPESRSMTTGKNGKDVCYNVQSAVDTSHHLIVAIGVTNDRNDLRQLAPMVSQVEETLGERPLKVTADCGYHCAEQLKEVAEQKVETYVPETKKRRSGKDGRFGPSDFVYDDKRNLYICPSASELTFRSKYWDKHHQKTYFLYRTSACRECRLRDRCVPDKARAKVVRRWEHQDIVDANDRRVAANPDVLETRRNTVEHPFGTLKRALNHGYFLMKRMTNVTAEISLSALVYNIKRLMKILPFDAIIEAVCAAKRPIPADRERSCLSELQLRGLTLCAA